MVFKCGILRRNTI